MNEPITVTLNENSSGLTDCPGYKVAAVASDIRDSGDLERLDLALLVSDQACSAAGVFTLNDVCAAPVKLCQAILKQSAHKVYGCVINSGNANACTGQYGMPDAQEMVTTTQVSTGIGSPFLVCSTGRIGRKLPLERIQDGIRSAAAKLSNSAEASEQAADAILTSDTRRKVATAQFQYAGKTITVSGMAKGAGMIEPNMATMLAFVVTDLDASAGLLKSILKEASDKTFNTISVDGDMSTNDTVLLFANGTSGQSADASPALLEAFKEAVYKVCDILAEKIVGDGEKVTKLVELTVKGCKSNEDAEKVARAVGNSLLVKTSWYGSDPNWGRIADAAGYARVGLDETCFDIHYDDTTALINGVPQDANLAKWKEIVSKNRFRITLNLNQGEGQFRILTSDLSEAYVDFNKSE
ncbi:MAG: bifunctional glutamate N-acetyltransferase/amino-acid acetyltransferase ArgJ [Verrucomicrobiota bacterium]